MHTKSLTELCDLDFTQSHQFKPTNIISPISYQKFVKKDVQQQRRLPSKRNLLVRSHNVTPSVGQYDIPYHLL